MKRQPSQADIEIGNRIVQMRKELDITGLDLAKRLGVTRGAVGNWELGKGIKRENLQLIADKYKISFDWLATGRGLMKEPPPPLSGLDALVDDFKKAYGEEADILREDLERTIDERKKLIERSRQTH
jgi:transcriptional regulator with XRE-family HTH domain